MEVYLSIDEFGQNQKPQNGYEISKAKKRASNNWQKIEIRKAAELIGNKGHAAVPGYMEGGLKAENCKAMQVFMMDFDDGISFREIKSRCDEMRLPIAFAYHTFSSSAHKEKFRIAFVHESLIDDPYIIRIAIYMLIRIFPECDSACCNPDRMFFGGKGLIWLDEDAHFALVQLIPPFYNALDTNKNFSRNIDSFAKKFRIAQYNNRLAMGDSSFFKDFEEYDGNKDFLIIHKIGQSDFPSYCVIEGKRLHQSIRCRIEKRKVEIGKGKGCRLLDDFVSGIEVEHDQRFLILTNLMQISGGVHYFFHIMEKFYETDSVEKWEKDIYHMKGYSPQRCTGEICPYYSICENAGTIVATLARDRKVYCTKDVEYHTLEEARDCMKETLGQAYRMGGEGIHLIKAQTGIGKTTAYIELIKEEKEAKFIIALPTIRLRDEIRGRLVGEGVFAEEIFVTKNINGNPLIPAEVQKEYVEAHERGEHELSKKIIKDYYEEIRDCADKRTVAEECRLYLEGMKALQGERVIVTTHAYFVNMPWINLQRYTVIIDEDILQLYFFKQMPTVSAACLQAVKLIGVQPYAGIAEQMLRADKDCYTRIQGNGASSFPGMEGLENLGCTDGSNVNDIIHAGAFVKMEDKGGGQYVRYFCPGQLPKAKYIILSATVNENMYRKYFENRLAVYSYPYLKAEYRGNLVQYTYHSLGRKDLQNKKQVFSFAKKAAGDENVEIITFKKAAGWVEMNGNNRWGIHFGNAVGINALEGKDIAIVGTPFLVPSAYKLIACHMGSDVNRKADKTPKIRRVGYKEYSFLIVTYEDPLLREIQLYSIESEMEQCIGRTRLLRQDCSIYVFSCFPCEQAKIKMGNYLLSNENGGQED